MGNLRRRVRGQKVGTKKTRRYRRIWRMLFANSYQFLLSYARKLVRDETFAEDVLQEVFLRLWRTVPNPSLITNHGAYLSRMVRNVSQSTRPRTDEVELDEIVESEPGLATEPDVLRLLELDEALLRLANGNEKDREALLRIKLLLDGFSIADIAAMLGEKESRTRYRIAVLRLRLRELMPQKSTKSTN